MPRHFGQLGLTVEQKESIYQIQGKHMPKIEALEKQIEDLKTKMILDCEATLSAAQKQSPRAATVRCERNAFPKKRPAPAKAQP